MRVISNDKIIRRNKRLSQFLSLGGMAILIGGLVYSFVQITPSEDPASNSLASTLPLITLFVGYMMSNAGMQLANRYVRPPRPDEAIDKALKGLNNSYDLYHYFFPASHVLFSPAGVHVFVTRFQGGTIEWNPKRRRLAHKGGSLFRSIFGQEGMGRPLAEVNTETRSVERFLEKYLKEDEIPPIYGVLVFTNPDMKIGNMKHAPVPVMSIKKLKEYIRKLPKGHALDLDQIDALEEAIGLE